MLNATIRAEAEATFERAVKLFKQSPTSQAYFALKDAALCYQETQKLPTDGYIVDQHIAHRVGIATVKVTGLEDLRDFHAD